MSLTTLKKTLAQMDADDMRQLITELYQARPEAKEYLDFFVQPDIDKRLEKARTNIRKELMRASRGRHRGRTTRIRRFIKDIASLNPGAEPVVEIMLFALETAAGVGSETQIKMSTQMAYGRLLAETVRKADEAGLLDTALPRIRKALGAMNTSSWYSRDFRELLEASLDETLESL